MKAQDIVIGETYAVTYSIRKDRPTNWMRCTVVGAGALHPSLQHKHLYFPATCGDGTEQLVSARDIRKTWADHEAGL